MILGHLSTEDYEFLIPSPDVKTERETEKSQPPRYVIWTNTEEVWASWTNLNQVCKAGPEQTYHFDAADPQPQRDVTLPSWSPLQLQW